MTFRIDAQPGVRPVSRMAPAPELGSVGWSTVCEVGASQGYGVVSRIVEPNLSPYSSCLTVGNADRHVAAGEQILCRSNHSRFRALASAP